MRGRFLLFLLALFALVIPAATTSVAAAGSSATLSQPLRQWLSNAGAGDTFDTIVTFHSRSGMSTLDSMGVDATELNRLPIAFARLSPAQIRELAASSAVRSIWHEQKLELYLDESVPLTKADSVQVGAGLKTPYTGAGANVAVIDTGVDATHPDLPYGAKVEQYAVAGDAFEREPMTFTPTPTGDTYGHGTHVSSTIGGLGLGATGLDGDEDGDPDRFVGMAPGAKITAFKTDVGAVLLNSWALASFDWILAHPEKNIRVSSNSWGSGDGTNYDPDDPINVTTKALYDAGITVLFAASNSGGPDTLNQYATSPWVISVAAGTKDLTLADFSSRGRLGDNWDRRAAQRNNTGIYRPTITAPGDLIEAAKSTQAAVMASGVDPLNPMYTYASGTSMATPHVAGAVALMLEARPRLTPLNVIDILEGTADNMPSYEIWEVGMGHLDALGAVQAAEKGKIHFPPAINGKTPQFTLTSTNPFSGTVLLANTWQLAQCPDTTGLLNHHTFTIGSGVDVVYAEIEWADPNQLIYLRLYDPNCQVAGESAALLDIGFVRHRAVAISSPSAGTWTVGVYGRINIPTQYTGAFSTYDKN